MAGGTPVPSYTTELERRTLRNLPTKGASSGHHSDAPDHIPVQVQLVRKCESTTYPHHQKKKQKKMHEHVWKICETFVEMCETYVKMCENMLVGGLSSIIGFY